MSKKIKANINCPSCENIFPAELYRTIWVEEPYNRSLILNDKINAVTCPKCNHHERLKFSFLCTNVKRNLALWYEPYPDSHIDKDVEGYRKHMGPDSFYAKAPRISDWKTFKEKLLEMEAKVPTEESVHSMPPEMQETMAGFMAYIEKRNRQKSDGVMKRFISNLFGRNPAQKKPDKIVQKEKPPEDIETLDELKKERQSQLFPIARKTMPEDFINAWCFSGKSLTAQGQSSLSWLRSHLHQPFDDHLSFRVGNQIFSVLIEVLGDQGTLPLTDRERKNQVRYCSDNNLVPCVYKVKKSDNDYENLYPDWNLLHTENERPINPAELISEELIKMSPWEIHDAGVQVVVNDLKKNGREVVSYQSVLNIDPSIWFKREGNDCYVIVKTVTYPESAAELPRDLTEIVGSVKSLKDNAEGYFASLSLANKDDPFDGKNPLPLYRGCGMYVSYKGLKRL